MRSLSALAWAETYTLTAGVPPATIPTLSEWAMILFGTVLAGGAALYIQRRQLTT